MGDKIDFVARNIIKIEKMNKVIIDLSRDVRIQKFIN